MLPIASSYKAIPQIPNGSQGHYDDLASSLICIVIITQAYTQLIILRLAPTCLGTELHVTATLDRISEFHNPALFK